MRFLDSREDAKALVAEILALSAEIRTGTIDRIMEMSDAELIGRLSGITCLPTARQAPLAAESLESQSDSFRICPLMLQETPP